MNNKSAIVRIYSGLFQRFKMVEPSGARMELVGILPRRGDKKSNLTLYFGWVPFLLVFICGCATIAAKRDTSLGTRAFLGSYEDVWNNLLDVISKKGDTVTVKNKTKGVILTGYDRITIEKLKEIAKMPPLKISSNLAGAWLYARNKIDYYVETVSSGQTQVKIIVYLQGYNASGQRWINIFTNGTKEKEILDELALQLGKKNN